jgi:hypothetical protein
MSSAAWRQAILRRLVAPVPGSVAGGGGGRKRRGKAAAHRHREAQGGASDDWGQKKIEF